ncbi:MAG TPA: (2Fe-2S)-binding protein [Polyangiaceae bacterium]|nr:(2Fe-2S)-binding protein [Polyangiaceae bacterium]
MAKTFACRCEDVTLGELDRAIEAGHRDIESLKRYTGFGTGICQGKWCLSLCAARLAEKGGDARHPMTPRPPLRPIRFATLAALSDIDD